jgi:hypothetical protein
MRHLLQVFLPVEILQMFDDPSNLLSPAAVADQQGIT